MSIQLEPASFAKALIYEASDVPPNMTLAQWRLEKRAAAHRRRRRRRPLRALRLEWAR